MVVGSGESVDVTSIEGCGVVERGVGEGLQYHDSTSVGNDWLGICLPLIDRLVSI